MISVFCRHWHIRTCRKLCKNKVHGQASETPLAAHLCHHQELLHNREIGCIVREINEHTHVSKPFSRSAKQRHSPDFKTPTQTVRHSPDFKTPTQAVWIVSQLVLNMNHYSLVGGKFAKYLRYSLGVHELQHSYYCTHIGCVCLLRA